MEHMVCVCVQDPTYRALSRQRNTQANERARTAQQVEPKDIMNAQRLARLREPASMKSAHKRVVGRPLHHLHLFRVYVRIVETLKPHVKRRATPHLVTQLSVSSLCC